MEKRLQRLFGGFGCNMFGNGELLILIILGAVLLMGDELLEWLLCEDMALIWVVLLILLLTSFDLDGCC